MVTTKRKDFTQTALDVVRQATGEVTAPAHSKKPESGRKGAAKTVSRSPAVKRRQTP